MISMDKKYQTRSGDPVRLLCVDRLHPTKPVFGLRYVDRLKKEIAMAWYADGRYLGKRTVNQGDLAEVLPGVPWTELEPGDQFSFVHRDLNEFSEFGAFDKPMIYLPQGGSHDCPENYVHRWTELDGHLLKDGNHTWGFSDGDRVKIEDR